MAADFIPPILLQSVTKWLKARLEITHAVAESCRELVDRTGEWRHLLDTHQMAHWAIPEILSAIAANLVSDGARASAVAMACCSTLLEKPALGEVWRSLPSLEPLVTCFPPDIWSYSEDRLIFERAPLRSEWIRFQHQYASKVRHLEVSSNEDSEGINPTALHLLQHLSHPSPLLPNLVSLNWNSDETFLPLIIPFISCSLTSVVITVPREATSMLPPILTRLSTSSPYVRDIQIRQLCHDPSVKEASSQLLMQCNPNRLRKYNVDAPISASAFRHIMQLPSLEEFRLVADSFQLPDPLPSVVFPCLRLLDVEYSKDPTWLKLLPAIDNSVLSEIFVRCPGSDVARLMQIFQIITDRGMRERLQGFGILSQGLEITPQIIASCLSFKNLTSFKLFSECSRICQTKDLTDGDIDLLTQAMPRLEYLAVGGKPCYVVSKITFMSLYTISHRCLQLRTLQVHFNPALFIEKMQAGSESRNVALGLSDHPSSDCPLTTINVGGIQPKAGKYNTSCIMALGLLGVFPRLEKLEYTNSYDWGETDNLIRVCRYMRSFAFGDLQGLGPN